jgi:hypothetical protein
MERRLLGIAALALVGLLVSIIGFSSLYDYYGRNDWEETDATITQSYVQDSQSTSTGRNSKTKTVYYPYVVYIYRVEGKSYRGTTLEHNGRLCFLSACSSGEVSNSRSSAEDAKEDLKNYPVDKVVPVYYRASEPNIAYLEGGTPILALIVSAIGIVLLGVVPVVARKKSTTEKPLETQLVSLQTKQS